MVMQRHGILVILLEKRVEPDLARQAIQNGWSFWQGTSISQGMREILVRVPRVVIVYILSAVSGGIDLIRTLRNVGHRTPIIAVAGSHNATVERAARGAGANVYLPGPADGSVLSRATKEILNASGPEDPNKFFADGMKRVNQV
jgi:DNA-binding response OmpR family regulator